MVAYLWRLLLPPSHKEQLTEHVWATENTGHDSLDDKPPTPPSTEEPNTDDDSTEDPNPWSHVLP